MKEIIEKEQILVENMIYEVRGKQVMLDSGMSVTKCHYLYDKIITHYDIGRSILMFNNFIGGKIIWN